MMLKIVKNRTSCALGLCCLPWLGNVSQAQPGPPTSALDEARRNELLTEMANIVWGSVQRNDTGHPIFHGCIDWHSAVHGHWALLRVARTTGRFGDEARWVHAALDPALVRKEAVYLQQHPQFEMPYGRAWFLRLAIEHDAWIMENRVAGSSALAAMADRVAESLLQHYRTHSPTPLLREYSNDSWALVQLYAYLNQRGDAANLAEVKNLIQKHFVTSNAALQFAGDSAPPDFFSRFGNWAYLVAQTQSRETFANFWSSRRPDDAELSPIAPRPGAAHHLGMNWSRAWALAAASRRLDAPAERARLRAAFSKHVQAGAGEFRRQSGNYHTYDHWVPQFAIYALTEHF